MNTQDKLVNALPVYQAHAGGDDWYDVSKGDYELTHPADRRVLYTRPHPATPNKTLDNPPQQFQRVLYWFEPFQKWYLGHYVNGSFCSYSGFCDHHDAPYWLPLPSSPKQ